MIRGSLTKADWTRLRHYTRTISKFIVTDKFNITNDASNARISPAVLLRLARLQSPDMSLLPNLSDLVIVDADASIAFLDLLITPSLKTLNASCIPDAQQSTFFFFLTAIEREVPFLQTLILGPGRFLPRSLQIISQFNSLRHLQLKHEDSTLPFAFFDNIGSLAMLEIFKLDARHVSGTMTGDEFNPFPSDNFPNSNAVDDDREEHGAADLGHSKNPICSFNQLKVLHVIGWLPLLEDLIHRVTSTKLEDVSVTYVRLSYDELTDSLIKEIEERERKAEEDRRREEREEKEKEEMEERERLLKDEMERKRIDEEKRRREAVRGCHPPPSFGCESPCEYEVPPALEPEFFEPFESPRGGNKKKNMKERRKREAMEREAMEMQEAMERQEVREKLLKEQERLARLSFEAHTVSFTEILRKLCLSPLQSLCVCQVGGSFQYLLKPPTLPEEVFRTMRSRANS